jgi:hypothetical protein
VRIVFIRASATSPQVLATAASARLLAIGETVRWSALDGAVPLLVVLPVPADDDSRGPAVVELAKAD